MGDYQPRQNNRRYEVQFELTDLTFDLMGFWKQKPHNLAMATGTAQAAVLTASALVTAASSAVLPALMEVDKLTSLKVSVKLIHCI